MGKKQVKKAKTNDLFLLSDVIVLKNATRLMRTIDNRFRIGIINFLNEWGEQNVTKIYEVLGMSQEVCSIHLRSLRLAGLVKRRRVNKFVFYSNDLENIKKLQQIMGKLSEHIITTEAAQMD
jgi:DNA-binding transcriptional ArsR family regulator